MDQREYVVIERIAIIFRFRDVHCPNLGQKTCYIIDVIRGFPWFLQENLGIVS
jgi:hypothetical protein